MITRPEYADPCLESCLFEIRNAGTRNTGTGNTYASIPNNPKAPLLNALPTIPPFPIFPIKSRIAAARHAKSNNSVRQVNVCTELFCFFLPVVVFLPEFFFRADEVFFFVAI